MAYDDELAARVRALLDDRSDLTEQRMFGGLAFLLGGNMAIAASGQGGLMVRVDAAEGARLIDDGEAEPMVMQGREMTGWLRIDAAAVTVDDALEAWVERSVAFASALAPKASKRRRAEG